MDSTDKTDSFDTFRKLGEENKYFASMLEEYGKIICSRDNEIKMLQSMLSDANEYRSTLDEQVRELKHLKCSMTDIQRQTVNSNCMVPDKQQWAGGNDSLKAQFENLKLGYAFVQSQLADLQSQLQNANDRNILLMLQTSRVAELESLLANFDWANNTAVATDNQV